MMTIKNLVHAASITGVAFFMMAASASAAIITFNTEAAGTGFGVGGAGGLTLNNTSGVAATLDVRTATKHHLRRTVQRQFRNFQARVLDVWDTTARPGLVFQCFHV